MVRSKAITHLYFLTDIVLFHDLIRENVVSETLSYTGIFYVSKNLHIKVLNLFIKSSF